MIYKEEISSNDLYDPSKAAYLLCNKYFKCDWENTVDWKKFINSLK